MARKTAQMTPKLATPRRFLRYTTCIIIIIIIIIIVIIITYATKPPRKPCTPLVGRSSQLIIIALIIQAGACGRQQV